MNRPLFRPAVVAARSRPEGDVVLPFPLPARLAATGAGVILLMLSLFLYFGHYTRTVRVGGRIVPSAGSIAVVTPQPGRIVRSLVVNGTQVAAGQVMFELNTERAGAGGRVDARIGSLLATRADELRQLRQLQAEELALRAEALAGRERAIVREVASRRQEAALQGQQVQAAHDRLERFSTLARRGFMSEAQLADAASALNAERARHKGFESNVLAIERELLQVREEARAIANKGRQADSQARHTLSAVQQEAAEHEGRSRVLVGAPVAGLVAALEQPAGQSVPAGSQLATILPLGSALEAHLLVPSRAVGHVRPGQPVLLRVDAFPYQKYGQVQGDIARVDQSPSAEGARGAEPVYRVVVRLRRQWVGADGAQLKFKAGMLLEADILQDRRRLIEWVIDPLVSAAKGRAG